VRYVAEQAPPGGGVEGAGPVGLAVVGTAEGLEHLRYLLNGGCRGRSAAAPSLRQVVPVTDVPDLVTRYVICVPLQKWKVSVTAPSLTSAKNSGFRMMVLAL
jgi:hypothetical protein